MDKGTASIFGTTVVITAAIIGGAYLLDRAQRSGKPLPPEQATWTELTPTSRNGDTLLSPSSGTPSSPSSRNPPSSTPSSRNSRSEYPGSTNTTNTPNVSAETPRTNQILTCNHPEYGTIYTNAASCEEADLHNRISVAEPLHQTPGQDQYSGEGYQTPENEAGNSRTDRKLIENE